MISIKYALPIITIMASWQLVHLSIPMYGYVFLAFKKPKSAEVTTGATNVTDMEEECGLKDEGV